MSRINDLPNGWVETILGEVCKVGDGAHSKVTRTPNGILYLTAKNFSRGSLKLDNVDYISSEDYNRLFPLKSRAVTRIIENDILMGIIGSFGNAYRYKATDEFGISSSVAILRPIKEKLFSVFLEQYLNSKLFRKIHETYSSGSVQGYSNIPTIKTMPISVPPLPEQKAIANVLIAFDDKIELLQAQNKTLETIAQAIFKEWFGKYQLDDKLPEGWRVGKFGEVIEFINGYAFKSKDLLKELETDCYKVFKMGDIKKGGGFNPNKTKSYFEKCNAVKLKKYILKNGDLLMSMTDMKDAISLLGHTALMIYDDEYIVNQRVGLIRAQNNVNIGYPYLYLLTNNDDFIANIRAGANSGVQVNLSTQGIKNTEFIIADKETNMSFNRVVMPLFKKIKVNTEQIKSLNKTRDTLLPKLMSGQVRVKNSAK